jgi:AcrR family transcriptional regulator
MSRQRNRGLSRAEIARVALEIADREGLEAVSIRRLARELGSGAMSLYHYFDSRDELLELMGDQVAGEMLVPELPGDWREALRAIAHRTQATFRRHPWLLAALHERPRASPNMLRHIEQTAQSLMPLQGTVPDHLLTAIVTAVDDYTLGFTLREHADPARFAEAFEQPDVRYLLESGEFPLLARFAASGAQMGEQDFDTGLDWLLDGFAAQIK